MKLKMKKDQLKFFPFFVTFKSQGIKGKGKQMTNSSDGERRMTGFTLNWFIEDINGSQLTEKLPPRQEHWKQEVPIPKYKEPLLAEMVQLARQLRMQNMTKEKILEEAINKKRKLVKKLQEKGMCRMGQVIPKNREGAFSKLVTNINDKLTEEPPSQKDIKIGYQIFQAIVYCPRMVIKLFRFVDQLLSSESKRTIIQTFVNFFQSGALTDKISFTLAKQFYFEVASTLDLQYGNVLLATLTNAQLQAAIRRDWPFFVNNTDMVGKCLQESHCSGFQENFQKLGILFF